MLFLRLILGINLSRNTRTSWNEINNPDGSVLGLSLTLSRALGILRGPSEHPKSQSSSHSSGLVALGGQHEAHWNGSEGTFNGKMFILTVIATCEKYPGKGSFILLTSSSVVLC